MTILFATSDLNRLQEMKTLFHDYPLKFLSLLDLGYLIPEFRSTQKRIEQTARNNAIWYYEHLQEKLPVLTEVSREYPGKVEYVYGFCTGKRLVTESVSLKKDDVKSITDSDIKESIIELIMQTIRN